ncbi:uncharacterized protein ACRADG_004969 isoform 2-T2 [Cochliomyia hominivorax]
MEVFLTSHFHLCPRKWVAVINIILVWLFFVVIDFGTKMDINYQIKETTYDRYGRYINNLVKKVLSNVTSITIKCQDNELYINDIETIITETQFSCLPEKWTIFSTKRPYKWCKNNQNSETLLLTSSSTGYNYVVAAVCYNMEQISLQTVVYNTSVVQRNLDSPLDIRKENTISNEDLDENLWNLKTTTLSDLSENLLQTTLRDFPSSDVWLNLANFEVSLIIQDGVLETYLNDFKSIFNIIWWRNLRLGNWKRFLNTLSMYAINSSYELYTGTSGVAQYPTNDKCIKEKFLEMKIGFKNETIPAYIWTYLKSNDNLNKDFIIVGYNSPYAEYFGVDKIKFCPDICSEIPWLHNISSTFNYTYAGIMFCCSTDFIRQTNYLQGFPMDILWRQQATTVVDTTTTEASLN